MSSINVWQWLSRGNRDNGGHIRNALSQRHFRRDTTFRQIRAVQPTLEPILVNTNHVTLARVGALFAEADRQADIYRFGLFIVARNWLSNHYFIFPSIILLIGWFIEEKEKNVSKFTILFYIANFKLVFNFACVIMYSSVRKIAALQTDKFLLWAHQQIIMKETVERLLAHPAVICVAIIWCTICSMFIDLEQITTDTAATIMLYDCEVSFLCLFYGFNIFSHSLANFAYVDDKIDKLNCICCGELCTFILKFLLKILAFVFICFGGGAAWFVIQKNDWFVFGVAIVVQVVMHLVMSVVCDGKNIPSLPR